MYRLFAWLAAWTGSGLARCWEWCRGTRREEPELEPELEQQRLPHLEPVCTMYCTGVYMYINLLKPCP